MALFNASGPIKKSQMNEKLVHLITDFKIVYYIFRSIGETLYAEADRLTVNRSDTNQSKHIMYSEQYTLC
jgi:hypothetical protein